MALSGEGSRFTTSKGRISVVALEHPLFPRSIRSFREQGIHYRSTNQASAAIELLKAEPPPSVLMIDQESVIPASIADIRHLLEFAGTRGVPVIVRGDELRTRFETSGQNIRFIALLTHFPALVHLLHQSAALACGRRDPPITMDSPAVMAINAHKTPTHIVDLSVSGALLTGSTSLVLKRNNNIQSVGMFFNGTAGDLPLITEAPSEVCAPKKYYDATGAVQTGTRNCGDPSAVQQNAGTQTASQCVIWDLTKEFPKGQCVSGISNAPKADSYCSASTGGGPLLGVAGSASCRSKSESMTNLVELVPSTMARLNAPQLTLHGEQNLTDAAAAQAAGYLEVPRISSTEQAARRIERVAAGEWETGIARYTCGTSGNVQQRISSCGSVHAQRPSWDSAKDPAALTWSGPKEGVWGEGTWTLVSIAAGNSPDGVVCSASCREIWRDDSTGLIWSDRIGAEAGSQTNWCQAVGHGMSTTPTGNPFSEDDPDNICDQPENQPDGLPTSWCVESSGWLTAITIAAGGKNGLAADQVNWRAPTLADWRRAELNGLRSVLPNLQHNFWTSTVRGAASVQAWQFDGRTGSAVPSNRASAFGYVRCIGR